jgi:hypothetical protein
MPLGRAGAAPLAAPLGELSSLPQARLKAAMQHPAETRPLRRRRAAFPACPRILSTDHRAVMARNMSGAVTRTNAQFQRFARDS